MNQLCPIENHEKIHLLKWYFTKEGTKVKVNEDLNNTVCIINGLDIVNYDNKIVNLREEDLYPENFECYEQFLVYSSFIENIKRLRLDRDFFMVTSKDNYFHWFNSAVGYLGVKKGSNLALTVDIDKIQVFEKTEFIEDGKEKFFVKERVDLNMNVHIDIDAKEYLTLLNKIKSFLTEKFFEDNFENDPVFDWIKDEPKLTDFEKRDDVVMANSKSNNIFQTNNISLLMNQS